MLLSTEYIFSDDTNFWGVNLPEAVSPSCTLIDFTSIPRSYVIKKEAHIEELQENKSNMSADTERQTRPIFGQVMLLKCIRTFRPNSVNSCNGSIKGNWTEFLNEISVNFLARRNHTRAQSLIDILYLKNFQKIGESKENKTFDNPDNVEVQERHK